MVDNDDIGGLFVDNDEIGVDNDEIGIPREKMSNSESKQQEREQERKVIHLAEMHGGGGDAKRSRKQRAQVVSERTDDNGECTLSYRKVGHTPGGINKTMIEHCSFCTAGEPCQNCVKVNCQNVSKCTCESKKNPASGSARASISKTP